MMIRCTGHAECRSSTSLLSWETVCSSVDDVKVKGREREQESILLHDDAGIFVASMSEEEVKKVSSLSRSPLFFLLNALVKATTDLQSFSKLMKVQNFKGLKAT
ncbi:hypothetical protein DY000_02041612 [Brassica cretica]|uniref:Uncharacterized protein n=1 Tax=Brassica cretica TaxID=69181 RepID=A0ABQ7BGD5_BRACR|nr:hypothetical protein DY000_02041612 [Brassica cretica]